MLSGLNWWILTILSWYIALISIILFLFLLVWIAFEFVKSKYLLYFILFQIVYNIFWVTLYTYNSFDKTNEEYITKMEKILKFEVTPKALNQVSYNNHWPKLWLTTRLLSSTIDSRADNYSINNTPIKKQTKEDIALDFLKMKQAIINENQKEEWLKNPFRRLSGWDLFIGNEWTKLQKCNTNTSTRYKVIDDEGSSPYIINENWVIFQYDESKNSFLTKNDWSKNISSLLICESE